jgi:hypothetical protein
MSGCFTTEILPPVAPKSLAGLPEPLTPDFEKIT